MKSTRIEWLDLLRGLAAIAIVVFHFHAFVGARHTGYMFVAVDMFFALSGVVLALRYTAAIDAGMSWLEFAGVRLRRLYPMVVIVWAFIVTMNIAHVPEGKYMVATSSDALTLLLVTPLFSSSSIAAFPPDPPIWSLWAELAANAVWFTVLKAKRGHRWMWALAIVSSAVLVVAVLRAKTLNLGWEPGIEFRLISLARAVAWFCVGYGIAMRDMGKWLALALLAGCLGTLVLVSRMTPGHVGVNELLGAATGVALLNLAYRLPAPGTVLGWFSRQLGVISFPLYLVHSPAGRLLPYFDRLPHWAALSLVVGACTIVATAANEALVSAVRRAYLNRRTRAMLPLGGP